MRQFHWLVLLLGILLCVSVLPGDDEPKVVKPDVPALTEEQAAAIARISSILGTETKIDVIEAPLNDICEHIGKAHKFNVILDPAGLRRAKVKPDELITLNLKGVPLRMMLSTMLKPRHLTYLIQPDGLLITAAPEKDAGEKK